MIRKLDLIQEDTFSQDDIELLLIWIREYLPSNSVERELADFVAHLKREKGLVMKAVSWYWHRLGFLSRQLDAVHRQEHMTLNLDALSDDEYQTILGHFAYVERDDKMRAKFERCYELDSGGHVHKRIDTISGCMRPSICNAVSTLATGCVLTQPQLIRSLKSALSRIGLEHYVNAIERRQRGIVIALLSILHGCTFQLENGIKVFACLSVLPRNQAHKDQISLSLMIPLDGDQSNLCDMVLPLVGTDLTLEECFEGTIAEERRRSGAYFYAEDNHDVAAIRNTEGTIVVDVSPV